MPATNARENILEAVKEKLETLSKANGYQNNIGLVERSFRPFDKVAPNEFPYVGILDDGSETNLNDWGGQAGDTTVRADIDLRLVGYYHETDPLELSGGFNRFKADLDKLFWAGNVLPGTQADDIQLTAWEAIVTLEDIGIIYFQAVLRIRYWFLKLNP